MSLLHSIPAMRLFGRKRKPIEAGKGRTDTQAAASTLQLLCGVALSCLVQATTPC